MPPAYNTPGVFRQELFLKPPPVLETGVPGFVGFVGPPTSGGLGYAAGGTDPSVAPTVAPAATGQLPAGTYFVRITSYYADGESAASPEASATLDAPGSIVISAPVERPAGALGYRVYAGVNSGGLDMTKETDK